jgi:hypothetical protein
MVAERREAGHEEQREHETYDANGQQDDADGLNLNAANSRVHGKGDDGADGYEEEASSSCHFYSPYQRAEANVLGLF